MDLIYLISCCKAKAAVVCRAEIMYRSRTFKLRRRLARQAGARWFILSSRHGLVRPRDVVAPYSRRLEVMARSEQERAQQRFYDQLRRVLRGKPHEIHIHAGKAYYDSVLRPLLLRDGHRVLVPTEGLTALRTFQHLKSLVKETT